jgi:hypothetical protein
MKFMHRRDPLMVALQGNFKHVYAIPVQLFAHPDAYADLTGNQYVFQTCVCHTEHMAITDKQMGLT